MEEKKVTKISLSTFFLILAIIAIIVMGIFIYKLNNDNILSSICTRGEKAIVIDCVISNSLESGIKDLNESLEMYYNDTYHFYKHAKEVVNNSTDILEYQKTIGSKDK